MDYDKIETFKPRSNRKHPLSLYVYTDNREAVLQIPNPLSYEEGGPVFTLQAVSKFVPDASAIAGLLSSYEFLLSPHYTTKDAIKRLQGLRRAYRDAIRAVLVTEPSDAD